MEIRGNEAEYIIKELNLQPHPEGGYYRETYRCMNEVILPQGNRHAGTSIYYLLENEDKSHLHRVKHDEIWYFHQGMALEIISVENRQPVSRILGNDLRAGQMPQLLVHAGTWFAARLTVPTGYALVSCSVTPGFDFRDFDLAGEELLEELGLPELSVLIRRPG